MFLHRTTMLMLAAVACSQPQRSVFRPSDPTFAPAAGNRPRAYTSDNIAELGGASVRSVGIIEVRVRGAEPEERAAAIAVEKGQQLGCWAVIEHAAFTRLQSRFVNGVTIHLAHGGAAHAGHTGPRQRIVKFDCVVRGVPAQRA